VHSLTDTILVTLLPTLEQQQVIKNNNQKIKGEKIAPLGACGTDDAHELKEKKLG
jgi:hypothetical protein